MDIHADRCIEEKQFQKGVDFMLYNIQLIGCFKHVAPSSSGTEMAQE